MSYVNIGTLINKCNETLKIATTEYVDNAVKTSMTRLQEAGKLGDSLYVDSDGKLQLK